jgi:hypothetical protein
VTSGSGNLTLDPFPQSKRGRAWAGKAARLSVRAGEILLGHEMANDAYWIYVERGYHAQVEGTSWQIIR